MYNALKGEQGIYIWDSNKEQMYFLYEGLPPAKRVSRSLQAVVKFNPYLALLEMDNEEAIKLLAKDTMDYQQEINAG